MKKSAKWNDNKENQRVTQKNITRQDGTTWEPIMNVCAQPGRIGLKSLTRKTKSTNRQKPRKR